MPSVRGKLSLQVFGMVTGMLLVKSFIRSDFTATSNELGRFGSSQLASKNRFLMHRLTCRGIQIIITSENFRVEFLTLWCGFYVPFGCC